MTLQAQPSLWVDALNVRPAATDGFDRLSRGLEFNPQLAICGAFPGDEVTARREQWQRQFSQFGHRAHSAADNDRPAGALLRLLGEVFCPLGQDVEDRRRLAGGAEG